VGAGWFVEQRGDVFLLHRKTLKSR